MSPSDITVLLAAILTAILTVVLGWINRHRLLRFFQRNFTPLKLPATDGFTVLVADLDGDPDCTRTNHLVEALGKMGGFHVRTSATVLKCAPVAGNRSGEQSRLRDTAQALLREHNADVLIWGRHYEQTFQLGFVPREGDAKTGDGLTGYDIKPDFTLPDELSEAMRDLLALTILTSIRPATEERGTYLVTKLRPLVPKLSAYLEGAKTLPAEQAGVAWHSLGLAYVTIGQQAGDNKALEQAIYAYGQTLVATSRESYPQDWARTQNSLGNALARLGERESGTKRLEQAILAYREALKERTRKRVPLDWAKTQNNLGLAVWRLGQRESGTERLKQAIQAYRETLKEGTRERVPLDWAATQNNLGAALKALGERESGTKRLEDAVQAYQEALKEYTRERVPLLWAATQNNLGNALVRLGERESGTKRLEGAVQAYQEALKEYTHERVPLDWAMTQNNLGGVLFRLGERESGTKRLEEAVQAYQEALKEYTRERVPLDWAATQNNLGEVLCTLAEKGQDAAQAREALKHFTAALEVFSQAAPYYRDLVEGNMRKVQALIEALEKKR